MRVYPVWAGGASRGFLRHRQMSLHKQIAKYPTKNKMADVFTKKIAAAIVKQNIKNPYKNKSV